MYPPSGLTDPSLASSLTQLQAALAEPGRARLLHLARAINDAHHAYNKAATDADKAGDPDEEKRRKMTAAAPAWLKGRVERGEELPKMEVGHSSDEDVVAAAVKQMVGEAGEMAKELFLELMEYMVPRWDDARSRV